MSLFVRFLLVSRLLSFTVTRTTRETGKTKKPIRPQFRGNFFVHARRCSPTVPPGTARTGNGFCTVRSHGTAWKKEIENEKEKKQKPLRHNPSSIHTDERR